MHKKAGTLVPKQGYVKVRIRDANHLNLTITDLVHALFGPAKDGIHTQRCRTTAKRSTALPACPDELSAGKANAEGARAETNRVAPGSGQP